MTERADLRTEGVPSVAAARRTFYLLTITRWVPTGFVVGLFVLWALDIGLSTAEALTQMAVIGVVVALLELPTSGFTDAFGRRPVYLAAAAVQVASAVAYLVAEGPVSYLLAGVLMGAFRALESGPLEAWFVDAVHVHEPGADVDQPLARAASLVGASMASTSLLAGLLVWWHPFAARSPLELPMILFAVTALGHLLAVALLMREVPHLHADAATDDLVVDDDPGESAWARALRSARATPSVIRSGLRLLRASAALRGVILAGALTSVVMVVQESLMPIRLTELLGDDLGRSGAWMGPVAALGWGAFALGAAGYGRLARRLGVARTAMLGRALHCLGALAMGLMLGPVALVGAYLLTYGLFGSGAMNRALMHREASADNRATVLSLESMVTFFAFALASPALGILAERTSTATAMVVAAVVGLAALPAYLPALRAERSRPLPRGAA
ncbi:hypothetical protein GCM10022199_08570 [Marihabitans asiaticum]|uniref:MFS transporter n=1 Tax=Marihabitans asiaticum TaxID=415218 RepID=A0A560WHC5_9MICO|nr:MFS transporter [Marihabitans asiaticum]TWD16885.1 MFS transporter [Marihabitans asiaticum]